MTPPSVRLAAIGDIHCSRASHAALQPLFLHVSKKADILLLCGDLTDYGLPEEAHLLAQDLATHVQIPVIAVLGNHDYESGKQDEVRHILSKVGVMMLDGNAYEVHGIGFAGVKGFAGGFGQWALQAWGEEIIKHFVREAADEALKLETALAQLRTTQRIAVLHYSPIRETLEGEPSEIFPFLGSSQLETPLNRYAVTAAFHGHAHQGRLEGRTTGGVPVYNVAAPLLRQAFPDGPLFRVINIPVPRQPEGYSSA